MSDPINEDTKASSLCAEERPGDQNKSIEQRQCIASLKLECLTRSDSAALAAAMAQKILDDEEDELAPRHSARRSIIMTKFPKNNSVEPENLLAMTNKDEQIFDDIPS